MSFLMAPRWDMICCIITSWKHHKITVISITESPITHSGLSRLTREKSETSALLITSGNPLTMAHHYHRHHHGDQGAVNTACPIGWCRQHQAMSLTGSLCLSVLRADARQCSNLSQKSCRSCSDLRTSLNVVVRKSWKHCQSSCNYDLLTNKMQAFYGMCFWFKFNRDLMIKAWLKKAVTDG